jgi:hypothetical protein
VKPCTVIRGESIVGGEVWLAICKGVNTDQSSHDSQLKATRNCSRRHGVILELTDLRFH